MSSGIKSPTGFVDFSVAASCHDVIILTKAWDTLALYNELLNPGANCLCG